MNAMKATSSAELANSPEGGIPWGRALPSVHAAAVRQLIDLSSIELCQFFPCKKYLWRGLATVPEN